MIVLPTHQRQIDPLCTWIPRSIPHGQADVDHLWTPRCAGAGDDEVAAVRTGAQGVGIDRHMDGYRGRASGGIQAEPGERFVGFPGKYAAAAIADRQILTGWIAGAGGKGERGWADLERRRATGCAYDQNNVDHFRAAAGARAADGDLLIVGAIAQAAGGDRHIHRGRRRALCAVQG
jgi:hypothetical protein